MRLNMFNKSRTPDGKPGFTHEINSDIYTHTKDLMERHLKAMYTELNEDLENYPRSHHPSRPSSVFHNPPRASSPNHSMHTRQHSSSAHHDPVIPEPFSNEHHHDDHDSNGHNRPEHGLGQMDDSFLGFETFDIRDAEPLPRPQADRHPEPAEDASLREREDVRISGLRTALGEALTPIANLTPLPTPPAHACYIYCYPPTVCPSQGDGFRSRTRGDKRGSRTPPDHDPRPRYTGNSYRPVSRDSIQRYHRGDSEALKEVRSKILYWTEACLKRLECLPGRTVERFRHALSEIPPHILLGERYMPEFKKLEDRLERFYWRIMKHDDFYYIRSACDAAQMRVETWSKYFILAKHLSDME